MSEDTSLEKRRIAQCTEQSSIKPGQIAKIAEWGQKGFERQRRLLIHRVKAETDLHSAICFLQLGYLSRRDKEQGCAPLQSRFEHVPMCLVTA